MPAVVEVAMGDLRVDAADGEVHPWRNQTRRYRVTVLTSLTADPISTIKLLRNRR
jgi:hypothetical protein